MNGEESSGSREASKRMGVSVMERIFHLEEDRENEPATAQFGKTKIFLRDGQVITIIKTIIIMGAHSIYHSTSACGIQKKQHYCRPYPLRPLDMEDRCAIFFSVFPRASV